MHVKDAIGTAQNVTLYRRIDVTDEVVVNELNCTEQIYKRFQTPFGLY